MDEGQLRESFSPEKLLPPSSQDSTDGTTGTSDASAVQATAFDNVDFDPKNLISKLLCQNVLYGEAWDPDVDGDHQYSYFIDEPSTGWGLGTQGRLKYIRLRIKDNADAETEKTYYILPQHAYERRKSAPGPMPRLREQETVMYHMDVELRDIVYATPEKKSINIKKASRFLTLQSGGIPRVEEVAR